MGIVIRAARRGDLPQIYRLLDAAFTDAPVQLFIDQTEGDSTMRLRHIRVAEVDGRIAAHVRIFARRMMIRGVPVKAGGIGSVASDPDARGLGLPSALLNDCLGVMAREGMAVSFLFTGIPAFYERLGWRIALQPSIEADAAETASSIGDVRGYRIRRIVAGDLPALLAIHRSGTAGTTGAIVRTAQTWRDAQTWLGEDPAGCLVAEKAGAPVAYLRSRSREYGYHLLEAQHLPGHEAAITALVAKATRRAIAKRQTLYATGPGDHPLTAALRTAPSHIETMHMRYPNMIRIVSLDALMAALAPQLDAAAREHAGPAFSLGLRAHDGQTLTLDAGTRVRMRRARGGEPQYQLDESSTLDALLGQRRTSDLLVPKPPAKVRQRIDALLPEQAFSFWNSDRI